MDPKFYFTFAQKERQASASASYNKSLAKHEQVFIFAWFGTIISSSVFASLLLIYISQNKIVTPVSQNFNLYTALPSSQTAVTSDIAFTDARGKIVEDFFKGYSSPLAQYANLFIQVADKYKLDYRLLPAISMQESNGAKKVITDSYNPFGFGIYGSKVTKFSSWEEAIETVGKSLRRDYLNEGLITPEQIMTKYTPPSLAKGGTWAKGVNSFIQELR